MNRFEEDVVFGKPFGAVYLGVQWKDGVLQQGWSEKVEQKTRSGRYLGTISRERWEDVPGTPAAEVGGQKSEVGGEPTGHDLKYAWVKKHGQWDVAVVNGNKFYLAESVKAYTRDFFEKVSDFIDPPEAAVRGQKSEVGGEPPLATMNWPCMIRAYATQMTHPDTAIKHEVIRHLHDQIGECLNAWEAEILNR